MYPSLKIFTIILVIVTIQTNAQNFKETTIISNLNRLEQSIYQWIQHQQLPNGLIKNTDYSNNSSLYNNAITAILFISQNDLKKAEAIFNYFEAQLPQEFKNHSKGFSQMRTTKGTISNRTWMGDNAWLLIALNTYHNKTKTQKYQHLSSSIEKWLRSLQDDDGGLWGGQEGNGNRIPKNTEGMLDAFHAVLGFDEFHINLLRYLKENRWDSKDQHLTTTEEKHKYSKALDLHSWSSCIFEDFPKSSLEKSSLFLTTHKITTNNKIIKGFCSDLDNDCVWLEGTGQMVVAYYFNDDLEKAQYFLNEMSKSIITSPLNPNLKGLPYVSNNATNFGGEIIWKDADTESSISSSVWYLFGLLGYNPFEIDFKKDIPDEHKFWSK
ncbi:MAG: hypothetical protein Q8S44_05515 [Flavobacteriaceae bacterium]|nr:hypothetical protein [Flavobacteriaceae bacterium]